MFSRRGILGLFSGLFSWFAVKKVTAAKPEPITALTPHPAEGYIQIPDWCPPGWIPTLGQSISKEQFPHLFGATIHKRKNGSLFWYKPPFHGLEIAPLPDRSPVIPTDLQAYGWQDRLTQSPRKEPDTRVAVHLIAAQPQVWPNGKVSQAGFHTTILVERSQFEAFYGLIEKPGSGLFYNNYEVLEHYPFYKNSSGMPPVTLDKG